MIWRPLNSTVAYHGFIKLVVVSLLSDAKTMVDGLWSLVWFYLMQEVALTSLTFEMTQTEMLG